MAWNRGWRRYVPVAQRRAESRRIVAMFQKQGIDVQPIESTGRKIAATFWGEAWCDHLESLGDYENRLPRGRTYVRNGSVFHLGITKGRVDALVMGSETYTVEVRIRSLAAKTWNAVRKRCAGRIGSLLELLQGRLSDEVMAVVTDRKTGLFPLPRQIRFDCSCPDWAHMCKHVAAVLYGVGVRLDTSPELLFLLRGVDQEDLIAADPEQAIAAATTRGRSKRLAQADLADVFGIDLEEESPAAKPKTKPKRKAKSRKKAKKRTTAKRTSSKQTTAKKKPKSKKKTTAKRVSSKKTIVKKKVATKKKAKKGRRVAKKG